MKLFTVEQRKELLEEELKRIVEILENDGHAKGDFFR
jgi:hypothetical protein